jgi:cytochrome o ubiquinol oxidase subunit 1
MLSLIFGKLSLDAIPHDPVAFGGVVFMVCVGLAIAGALTYFKLWKWLWDEYLTSLDPKKIGIMYIAVAVIMLVRGLVDASMIRLQQALSVGDSHGYLAPDHFQQIFTAHGTIMIFFVAMPIMFGLINLIMPLQIGARDVAFPFLNSISFWLFVAGAALVNVSLVLGEFATTGWLSYPPLSELQYSPGVGVDYWLWALQIAGFGSLFSGINFIATIVKMRAPGMTLMRMPIFVWTVLSSMILVVFAFPILTATLAMLAADRTLGMHFFTTDLGGNVMMYVNLIWAWGHPEVYILVLPAFGIFSEIVPVFSQKRLFGYRSMVYATAAITFFSFIVWAHHFFTMGAGAAVNAFFGIMTMVIAIPTGVKIFNWLFTMFRGRVISSSMMHWFLGFVSSFTIGGMTGVLLSIPAADFELHNSLFLVAHFHNMIVSGVLFGYFAGIAYWFPKIFGFKLNERLGIYAFWCWIIGFFVAFMPLYILGIMGATRRLDHYDPSLGWQSLFIVAGVGVMIIVVGVLFQILQMYVSIRDRKYNIAGPDPWNARTLEWSVPSPAPFYNFARIPIVFGRDAFWTMKRAAGIEHERPAQNLSEVEAVVANEAKQFLEFTAGLIRYEDIVVPKNTPFGLYIGACSFLLGFGVVWHMYWLVPLALLSILTLLIIRSFDEEIEEIIPAAEIERMEKTYI